MTNLCCAGPWTNCCNSPTASIGFSKAFELKKHDFVSDGEFRDLLHLEDVLDAFRAFHQDEGLPGFLEWRRIEIM